MTRILTAQPLTREAFSPYGQVLDMEGWDNHYPINAGRCERYHDLVTVDTAGTNARAILSIFKGTPYDLPLKLTMVERHPFGSQAFMPLQPRPYLVIVAQNTTNGPAEPEIFLAGPGQGVNYPRNLWHGVLTPLNEPQDFLVADRAGDEPNVEEFVFDEPYEVRLPLPEYPEFDEPSFGAKERRRVRAPKPLRNG